MTGDDRELLAELARLNTDVVPLAMCIMDASIRAQEQYVFAQRLISLAGRLQLRATAPWRVVEGDVALETEHGTLARQER